MDGVPTKMRLVVVVLALLQGVRCCSKSLTVNVNPQDYYSRDNSTGVLIGCICNVGGLNCLRKCCNDDEVLDMATCVKYNGSNNESFGIPGLKLPDDNLAPSLRGLENLGDHFHLLNQSHVCPYGSFILEPENIPEDKFVLDEKGTVRTSVMKLPSDRFCLDWKNSLKEIRVVVCYVDEDGGQTSFSIEEHVRQIGMIISVPFMIATLSVYAIISELRNIHGKTLMCYVACLIYSYSSLVVTQMVGYSIQLVCVIAAFTIHFSFLASFFWLNVMCFDIWWTFGGFRSLQGSIKQRERKKFLMYSIYAWGCATLLTAVCVIMDFVPGIPDNILRPEFGVKSCWFKSEEAKALYFYGPMGLTVICNIFLFISTAAKIIRHKRDTAHHLKGMDSKRHDDDKKQWFNLYLKLFIVMGINWSMEIISWLCQGPKSLWYLTDIVNSLQGVIIFIIFVWKQKIKRLLMKRFGCKGQNFLSRDSTRSAYHSSSSRTCTTSIPLHEKTNQFPDPVSKAKTISDDSDGV